MSSNLIIDTNQYPGAAMYAKLHNISVKQLIENFLMKFPMPTSKEQHPSLQLPPHLDKLGGCLADIADSEDEKLKYLLEKYK